MLGPLDGSSIQSNQLNLRPYRTAGDMWNCLQQVYHQENDAHCFQLEDEIPEYNQGDKNVPEYYSRFMNLCLEMRLSFTPLVQMDLWVLLNKFMNTTSSIFL